MRQRGQKKRLWCGLMLLFFSPASCLAAESNSPATVTFTAGEGQNEIVDPEKPTDPVQPVEPIQPSGGPLTIDYASQWQFSAQKISTRDQRYYAQLDQMAGEQKTAPFVQVTDKRGTLAGWKLSVMQQGQFQTASGRSLEGAELTLKQMAINSTLLEREEGATYQPTFSQEDQVLTINEKQILLDAQAGTGVGTWSLRFGDQATTAKQAVELQVPGNSVKLAQKYSTKIVWTLENTPSNGGNES